LSNAPHRDSYGVGLQLSVGDLGINFLFVVCRHRLEIRHGFDEFDVQLVVVAGFGVDVSAIGQRSAETIPRPSRPAHCA